MHDRDDVREASDRVSTAVSVVSALGRGVSMLLADMERELQFMAADLTAPQVPGWEDHRAAVRRTRRPGFRQ